MSATTNEIISGVSALSTLPVRSSLWSSLPTPDEFGVGLVFVSDVGVSGSLWYSNGTTWGLANGSCLLFQMAVSVSVSATTSEEVLFSGTLPAGIMGINGALRCSPIFTVTNSANTKTLRIRTGSTALGGSAWAANSITTQASQESIPIVWRNRGAVNSQITYVAATGHITTQSSTANTTHTEDTSVAMTFAITGQKVSAGETITLEGFTLELLRA